LLTYLYERESRGMFALAAIRPEVLPVIDVREGGSLQLGVFHVPKLAPAGCGLLLYKSYSVATETILYKADAG
jgi:hypothetical protein